MNVLKKLLSKLSIFLYRLFGSIIIFAAITMSLLYFVLPLFISADEIKAQVLKNFSLPLQFQSIEWGVWGLSPTIVMNDVTLYQQKVEKLIIEFDWVQWLKTDKISIKKVFFKKANLALQYREDKIYLESMPDQAIFFNQESKTNAYTIHELVLIDSQLSIKNALNQVFETNHTDIAIINASNKFVLHVKGKLVKKNAPFQFGLTLSDSSKEPKSQLYISGEDIALVDLQFFFKDILISGQAKTLDLWLEGGWGNFDRFIAKGDIKEFEYIYENRKLYYPTLRGQFGMEWRSDSTEYLGLDIQTKDQGGDNPFSQFYVNIPKDNHADITLLAKDFPLSRLDNIFTVFLADKPGLTQWWQKAFPRGNLDYFNVTIPDILDVDGYSLTTLLSDLSGEIFARNLNINKNPYHLSVDKIDSLMGYYTKEGIGKFSIESKSARFQDNIYYTDGLSLKNLSGTLWYWNDSPKRKKLYLDHLVANLGKAHLEYDGFWEKNLDENFWQTESLFFQDDVEIDTFLKALPKNSLDKGLSEWLTTAFTAGQLKQTHAVFRGRLKDFPFLEASTGVVEADVQVENATIKYQADWPALENTDGDVELEGPKLTVKTTEGEIFDSPIGFAEGSIANINAPYPSLEVEAKINSNFTKARNFVEHSPLKNTLSEKLAPLNLSGPMDVLLDLNVPLNINSPDSINYRGVIDFKETKLAIPKLDLSISSLNGSIFFSPRGVSGKNLSGDLFGMPTKFSIVSDILASDPRVKVFAKGQVEIAKLNTWFRLAKSDLITGKTNYTAELFLKNTSQASEGELKINSDLVGVSVHLPKPFQKTSEEIEPFDFNIHFSPQSIINLQLKYGQKINVDYELKATNKSWVPHSGRVLLGDKQISPIRETDSQAFDKTSFFSENPFSVQGELDTLDLSEWQAFFDDSKNKSFSSNFFVKLKVKKLKAFGENFENMLIQVSPSGLLARELTLIGDDVKAKVILPIGSCDNTAIKANFEYLNFSKSSSKEEKPEQNPLQLIKTKVGGCPIELTIKKLVLDKKIFESVFVHLIPEDQGFALKEIRAKAPYTTLQASGFWRLTPKSQIDLKGIIQTKNIQNTLQAGGIESTLYAATGQIRFDLNWEKDLTDIDLSTVNGEANVFLRNGYIKDAEPGIGRILGLLSLDNILRRLQLDFSDVAKEGLSMDKLTASFHFYNGIMKTDDLVLDSPAARVELLGEAVLKTKTIEGTLKVMPKITGSLPIAAAIAVGNPAVGAAVWLADKVLGRTIQEITQYQYQLSGTLDKPKLTSAGSKNKKVKKSNNKK
jgi:uncharacterized protein (TIGR02099 family)